ncbi:MAG TPA: hypothetical protein VF092_27385 [Longimicrobium sp.]
MISAADPPVRSPRPAATRRPRAMTAVRVTGWIVLVALGALQAWAFRHAMNPDGISYLDVADSYARDGLRAWVNGYWSPLYPWVLAGAFGVLRPSPATEFAAAHAVNFALYLLSLAGFELFLRELLRWRRERHGDALETPLAALGYAAFAWGVPRLVTLELVTPDLIVAALTFACAALLLRASRDGGRPLTLGMLGAAAGVAYLAKAAMFPVGFVTVAAGGAIVARGRGRRVGVRGAAMALAAFLLVSAPLFVSLSISKHRPTFGDVGTLAYAWYVDNLPQMGRWEGGGGTGTPAHAPRVVYPSPRVYAFAAPVPGTYPLWYDASYWYEGIRPPVNLPLQAKVVGSALYHVWYPIGIAFFPLVVLAGALVATGLLRAPDRSAWLVALPSLATFAAYSMVHIEMRFIGAQLCVVLLLFLATLAPAEEGDWRLPAAVLAAAVLPLAMDLARSGGRMAVNAMQAGPENAAWAQARALHAADVPRGARVGLITTWQIEDGARSFWARAGRMRIVAETWDAREFWSAPPAVQQAVLDAMERAGATVVVAAHAPSCPPERGWRAATPELCVLTPPTR